MPVKRKTKHNTEGGAIPAALIPLGISIASSLAGVLLNRGIDYIDRKTRGRGVPRRTRRAHK
jgi:hypothetical protein